MGIQTEANLEEIQETIATLRSSGMLVQCEEEAKMLKLFRMLNKTNKLIISSKIEGMLEAQMYAQVSDK